MLSKNSHNFVNALVSMSFLFIDVSDIYVYAGIIGDPAMLPGILAMVCPQEA